MPAISIGSYTLGPIPLDVLLLAGRAAFLVFAFLIAAVAFVRWRRAAERDTEHTCAQTGLVLERLHQLETLIGAAQARLAVLGEQLESRQGTPGTTQAPSYQIAIRMARSGAERAELMKSCGLTQQEADLVSRLHGPRPRAVRGETVAA
ncbi:MAG TPA: DUF2802 domain-containing protein [Steroidobacteraceae bacterium]|nr:DUF2802 domain-containing protein [Steroidobacteraceae bacterium]